MPPLVTSYNFLTLIMFASEVFLWFHGRSMAWFCVSSDSRISKVISGWIFLWIANILALSIFIIKSLVLQCILLPYMVIVMEHATDNLYSVSSNPLLQKRRSLNASTNSVCVCVCVCISRCVCIYTYISYIYLCLTHIWKWLGKLKLIRLLYSTLHIPPTGTGNDITQLNFN